MKIEVGKRYCNRNGGVSGYIRTIDNSDYPFSDGYDEYTEEGLYWSNAREHAKDLIREYVEPSQEVPGLEGYRIVRWGKVKRGELFLIQGGVSLHSVSQETIDNYIIVEKIAPEKRTIVFKEAYNRYGNRWSLDWRSDGEASAELLPPDETIYTGNTREVTV